MKFDCPIKWSGSKRSQSENIVKEFPKEIRTYYEPFIGSASVLYQLLYSDIKVDRYICSDINKDLINLWNNIKNNPIELGYHYEGLWNELNKDEDLNRKREYYSFIRDRFNKERNSMDFLFILRTTTNGLVRYNSKGEFNNSFHFSRNGINPKTLKKIINEWSLKLNEKNVEFIHRSFEEIQTEDGDLLYLDPPYHNTKGMYYGGIDLELFFDWLKKEKASFVLSFDGKTISEEDNSEIDNTYKVNKDIYDKHIYLKSGKSSFRKLKNNNVEVYESLYIRIKR